MGHCSRSLDELIDRAFEAEACAHSFVAHQDFDSAVIEYEHAVNLFDHCATVALAIGETQRYEDAKLWTDMARSLAGTWKGWHARQPVAS